MYFGSITKKTIYKWQLVFDEHYKRYYWYNPVNNISTWEKPDNSDKPLYLDQLFNSQWLMLFDDKSKQYYWLNSDTKETTWEQQSWNASPPPIIDNEDFYYIVNVIYNHNADNTFYIKFIYNQHVPTVLVRRNKTEFVRVRNLDVVIATDFVQLANDIQSRISNSFVNDMFLYSLFVESFLMYNDGIKQKAIDQQLLFIEGCENNQTQTHIKNKWISNGLENQLWSTLYTAKPIFVIAAHGSTVLVRGQNPIIGKTCHIKSFTVPQNTQIISFTRSGFLAGGAGSLMVDEATIKTASKHFNPEYYLFDDDGITRNIILPAGIVRRENTPVIPNCQKLFRYKDMYNDVRFDFYDHNGAFPLGAMGVYVFNSSEQFTDEFLKARKLLLKNGTKHPKIVEYIKSIEGNDFQFLEEIKSDEVKVGKGCFTLNTIIDALGEGTYYVLACRVLNTMEFEDKPFLTEIARQRSRQELYG